MNTSRITHTNTAASLLHCLLFVLLLLMSSPAHAAVDESFTSGRTAAMDFLIERAIATNQIAGGVVAVGTRENITYVTARGTLTSGPQAPPLNEHTMFDVASLTKVIATTPAVVKLLDEGQISLNDPLSRWFPEFRKTGSGITILNLLTHTSGLSDFDLGRWQGMKTAIKKAAKKRISHHSFNYADINFILLGELVHRVSGKTLDRYCRDEIFLPLGAKETMFLPPATLSGSIAPTSGFSSGVVQDQNARRLGGVAGHAGLFSSVADLARFARMVLNGGELDGRRVLSERAVAQMTTPYQCNNGRILRGLGWDINSPFSAPKGSYFSDASFGHTGYSGSSIWIDPQRNQFVIMLTTRLNYHDTRMFNQLRSSVSTLAVATMMVPEENPAPATYMQVAQVSADLIQEPRRHAPSVSTSKMSKKTKVTKGKRSKIRHEAKKKGKNHRRKGQGRIQRA